MYEYYTTYNNSESFATYETGYLNNGTSWWLITPQDSSDILAVLVNGNFNSGSSPTSTSGIRPSINLKSDIQIVLGEGTVSNPYRLEGDTQETINGATLLSTRYSGEYIRFNNELYRIVGAENKLTKITAVDKPQTLSKNRFHSSSGMTSFTNSDIKKDLESYYTGLDATMKGMIEPNTTWYLGTIAGGVSYKKSVCATVDANTDIRTCTKTTNTTANIGLPRLGEMFTSQITRKEKESFWTLTPQTTLDVLSVSNTFQGKTPTNSFGARPSMYLKSNVVISKNNTGDGTYEHPYDIELGA